MGKHSRYEHNELLKPRAGGRVWGEDPAASKDRSRNEHIGSSYINEKLNIILLQLLFANNCESHLKNGRRW